MNKTPLLVALSLGIVAAACAAPAEPQAAEVKTVSAPAAVLAVPATRATFDATGIAGWRVYRGYHQTVVMALDKAGKPAGAVRIEVAGDRITHQFLTEDYGSVSVDTKTETYANTTQGDSRALLDAAAYDLPREVGADGKVAYGCGLTLAASAVTCSIALAACATVIACVGAGAGCVAGDVATYNCFEGEYAQQQKDAENAKRQRDLEDRLKKLEQQQEKSAQGQGGQCTQSVGGSSGSSGSSGGDGKSGCSSVGIRPKALHPLAAPVLGDGARAPADAPRVAAIVLDLPAGVAAGPSPRRDASATGLSCDGASVLDCGMSGGRPFCRCAA